MPSLRLDVASAGGGANCRPCLCSPRRWSPLFVALLETKVVCLGPLPPVAVQPPPSFAALRHCRGTLFDRRCLGPLPPLAVQPPWPFATLRRVCLGCLSPLAVQPPPPFKDIFQKYLDWEVRVKALGKREGTGLSIRIQSEEKLLGTVLSELLLVYATQLYENEHPGLHALLRDEKIFLGKAFQVAGKGVYIIFMSVILSFQALDGAFNVFCNENVGNISSAKMLAANCHDILKRGRKELVKENNKDNVERRHTSPDFHMLKCKLMDPDGIISILAFCPAHSGMLATGSYSQTTAIYTEDNMELLYVLHGQEGGITHDKLQRRRQELTQTTPDQPVDDEAVYYKVAGDCPKGCV
ncbi:hypothetical protein Scep_025720 [Stephania cephalantha]|uniref:Uncharacterized protein n=1 Tax=Stephania cephalantha TaxID=152367 RepID=A0AAP0EIR9_9MAGN